MSHTPGESRDSEMSEEEIIEVSFICSVHAIIINVVNRHAVCMYVCVVRRSVNI